MYHILIFVIQNEKFGKVLHAPELKLNQPFATNSLVAIFQHPRGPRGFHEELLINTNLAGKQTTHKLCFKRHSKTEM